MKASVLDTCKVENVMNSWAAKDSVENGSDSSGYGTSDCGAVGALIFQRLFYLGSCSKWLFCFLLCVVRACALSLCFLWSLDCV